MVNDYDKAIWAFGIHAKILFELHLQNPRKYDFEFVLDQLEKEYVKSNFEPLDEN